MRLVYPEISTPIDFEAGYINSLIVENPSFYYELVTDLYVQTQGLEGKFVLSDNEKIISVGKNVELITDFITFDVNSKGLLTKIVSRLAKDSAEPEHYEKSQILLADIERFIYDLVYDYELDVQFDKLTADSVLKAVGIKIADNAESLPEKIISYMELIRAFDSDKLFIFVNLRSYIDEKQFKFFIDTIIGHSYKVLLLDNYAYNIIENEKRLVIDNDLCEI